MMAHKNSQEGPLPLPRWTIVFIAAVWPFNLIAQDYPFKPIRLIVGFAPGGASDILARLLAGKLSTSLGQTMLVDNRASAGGVIGTELVARSTPDGYTLLLGSSAAFAITPHLVTDLPFNISRDFVPIGSFASVPFVLDVSTKVAARSVPELIALARSSAAQLNLGSAGNGTTTHMAGELFAHMAKIRFVHVPYKGAGPAMVELLAGRIDLLFDAAITTLPHLKSGRLRALAVTSAKRSELLPDLPTIGESGVPGYAASSWFGVFGPVKLPPAIVQKLNAEIVKVMNEPEVRTQMAARGADVVIGSPLEFQRFVRDEYKRYGELVKTANLKIN